MSQCALWAGKYGKCNYTPTLLHTIMVWCLIIRHRNNFPYVSTRCHPSTLILHMSQHKIWIAATFTTFQCAFEKHHFSPLSTDVWGYNGYLAPLMKINAPKVIFWTITNVKLLFPNCLSNNLWGHLNDLLCMCCHFLNLQKGLIPMFLEFKEQTQQNNTLIINNCLKLLSTDNLRSERYLRNADCVALHYCPRRQHRSAGTICVQTFIIHTLRKYVFNCTSSHWIHDWCFKRAYSAFRQVMTSHPWLSFPSSLPPFLTLQVSSYQPYTVLKWYRKATSLQCMTAGAI